LGKRKGLGKLEKWNNGKMEWRFGGIWILDNVIWNLGFVGKME